MKNITITRRLNTVLDELEHEFRAMCDIEDFEHQMHEVKVARPSERPSKLRKLFDMFDMCDVPYERGKDNDYYESIIKTTDIPSFSEIEDRMTLALFQRFERYPSPEEYMKRIVDRLSVDEEWESDTLRLRILKQFIKYGNYLADAKISGKKAICDFTEQKIGHKPNDAEVLQTISDDIFDLLIEQVIDETLDKAVKAKAKAQRKENRRKLELLKIADDLATGKFRTEGATKKYLYMFAMVYGMTYYSGGGADGEIYDPETDIEKNLFTDYYSNNLIRFVSEAYQGKLSEYDLNPSGQGINYKNYAEMVYLYYISSDCTPQEKISRSYKMIERIRESQFSNEPENEASKQRGTLAYRGYMRAQGNGDLYSEDLLGKTEEDFERFLCGHYDCNTYAGSYEIKGKIVDQKTGAIQLEQEQHSAFEEYRKLICAIGQMELLQDDCNYGLYFTDIAAFGKNEVADICDRNADIDRDKFASFTQMLVRMDSLIKNIFDATPESVTRATIIGAYYYLYNARHEDDAYRNRKYWKNFEDLFKDFQAGVNAVLERAYYQPFSGRNLFDVMTAFSAYAYLNV